MEFPERVVSYVMVAAKPEAKMQMVLIQYNVLGNCDEPEAKMQMVLIQYSVLKTVILHKHMVHAVQHDYILEPISIIIV